MVCGVTVRFILHTVLSDVGAYLCIPVCSSRTPPPSPFVSPVVDRFRSTFILQPRRRRAPSAPPAFVVEHVFPILESFTINMAQSRRNTMNLTSSAALNQPRAGDASRSHALVYLTVWRAQSSRSQFILGTTHSCNL